MENFLNYFVPERRDGGLVVSIPVPPEKMNGVVAADDIGKAAAVAIADPEKYTGADLHLFSDVSSPRRMIEMIGNEMGLPGVVVHIPLETVEREWPVAFDDLRWLSTRTTQDSVADLAAMIGTTMSFQQWAHDVFVPAFAQPKS
jgi:uncharacterized protein YbjT (DUF2867 family)